MDKFIKVFMVFSKCFIFKNGLENGFWVKKTFNPDFLTTTMTRIYAKLDEILFDLFFKKNQGERHVIYPSYNKKNGPNTQALSKWANLA